MFDFLLQRFGKKTVEEPDVAKKSAQQAAVSEAREAAMLQAGQLIDENEAVEFITGSTFAEARFAAAQKIHSKAALEKVRLAMRNTDRRVARLMQARLDELNLAEKQLERLQAAVAVAQKLENETILTPNMVADLDRLWQEAEKNGIEGGVLPEKYQAARAALAARLVEQTALQRQVMDALSLLRRMEEEEDDMTPSGRERQLAEISASREKWMASSERASLPRQLLAELDALVLRLESRTLRHAEIQESLLARENLLREWEAADFPDLHEEDLKKRWQSLPEIPENARAAALQERFEALLQRFPGPETAAKKAVAPEKTLSSSEARSLFVYALTQMQKAVQDGAVREATQQNENISRLNLSAVNPTDEEKALLAELRAELKNLVGWAKWSGEASREELIRIVEALHEHEYPVDELAAAVSEVREKWKALNETSGMASRAQWQQFDAACNRAYEPVLEHARSQAALREQNALKAQAIIETARETLSEVDWSSVSDENAGTDWRRFVDFQRRKQRAWRQITLLARKDKKRLDAEFSQVMQPLNDCLRTRAKIEIEKRRELIAEAGQINPEDRGATRKIRLLQERWQERARAFPLENREDRKLWQQFRGACETVFVHRSKVNEELEKERLQHFYEKEKLCEKLEAADPETDEKILEVLREADRRWSAIGPVPKEHESAIQERYDRIVRQLLEKKRQIKNENRIRQQDVLIEKLGICQRLEHAVCEGADMPEGLSSLWEAVSSGGRGGFMQPRFRSAERALREGDAAYAETLKAAGPQLMDLLLRLEIAASVDSPPEFAEERRQMKLEVLKDSLSGNLEAPLGERLRALCAMPALTDGTSAGRLVTLVRKIYGNDE